MALKGLEGSFLIKEIHYKNNMRIGDIPEKIADFFKEVGLEIKKVNWPSRQETIRYTLVVIGVSLVVALFLGGLDILFQYLLNRFILK